MEAFQSGGNVLFILLGAIMVLAMHAGFAFLEVGTVRKKNQVNALVKILTDFAMSTIAYFFIGYSIAYGVNFFSGVDTLLEKNGFELTKFFFLLTFAAAIPAIVQRMKSVDEALRVQGLQVIRKMEGRASPALPILRNMLQNDAAWNVRLHALDAIAHAAPGDPSVRRDVEGAAAGDSDERVRARARWALESVLRDR